LENEGVKFLASEDDYGPGVRVIAKVPNVLRWPTKLGTWEPLLVPVEWRGQKVNVFVSHEVLEDLGRFRETQPAAEYLRIYEEHRSDILQAAAVAIDAGRVTPDKRAGIDTLLDSAAGGLQFRQLLETEARSLTVAGNTFQIRHHEVGQEAIASSAEVDYLFHRLFALTQLLLAARSR
jgi:hypothetical protein